MFYLSSYAAGCQLPVAPQLGAKNQVKKITIGSNCNAGRVFKNLRKIVEDRVKSKK